MGEDKEELPLLLKEITTLHLSNLQKKVSYKKLSLQWTNMSKKDPIKYFIYNKIENSLIKIFCIKKLSMPFQMIQK